MVEIVAHKTRVALVLEDMEVRVEWLEEVLEGTGVDVVWCTTVADFRRDLAYYGKCVELIVLDHDLGRDSTTSEDERGETGLDGAKAIPVGCTAPVLLWSINPSGRERMALELRSRGIVAAAYPFLRENMFGLMGVVMKSIGGVR